MWRLHTDLLGFFILEWTLDQMSARVHTKRLDRRCGRCGVELAARAASFCPCGSALEGKGAVGRGLAGRPFPGKSTSSPPLTP